MQSLITFISLESLLNIKYFLKASVKAMSTLPVFKGIAVRRLVGIMIHAASYRERKG